MAKSGLRLRRCGDAATALQLRAVAKPSANAGPLKHHGARYTASISLGLLFRYLTCKSYRFLQDLIALRKRTKMMKSCSFVGKYVDYLKAILDVARHQKEEVENLHEIFHGPESLFIMPQVNGSCISLSM